MEVKNRYINVKHVDSMAKELGDRHNRADNLVW